MTSFENEIMMFLLGDYPRQKYEYLKSLVDILNNRIRLCDIQAKLIDDLSVPMYPREFVVSFEYINELINESRMRR
jgi:hypothetical protein